MRSKVWIAAVLVSIMVAASSCGVTSDGSGAPAPGGVSVAGLGQSYPIYGSPSPGLTVVGIGRVEADPDIVYLTLGVDLSGDDAAIVVAEAGRRMERLLAALETSGVSKADIRTASYNLWVEQRYDPMTGQPTGVIKYHIVHTVRVTVRDIERVGAVLAAGVEAGANTVHEVTFSVADAEQLASQARQQAVADAQRRAQEMATALNVTLGRVVSVSESGGYVPTATYYERGMATDMPAAVPMPAGSFSVSVSVVLVYELP